MALNNQIKQFYDEWEKRKLIAQLFCEWIKRFEQRGEAAFNTDGILFLPDGRDGVGEWILSDNRIVFLLKDQNQEGGPYNEDIRLWRTYDKIQKLEIPFIRILASYLWGLTNIKKEGKYDQWWFNETRMEKNYPKLVELFNAAPVAFVECKKVPGCGKIDNKVLEQYLKLDGDLLKQEIEILNPTIVVCCSQKIYDYVIHRVYNYDELTQYGKRGFCYHSKRNILIMCALHPSAYRSEKEKYEMLMADYRYFLSLQ